MNQSHGRILYAAQALGLGFGLGKLMVFRRSDLHRVGGFEAIAHSVGEDSALDHALKNIGLRTVIISVPLLQPLGARSFHDVYHRQLRWSVIRRHNETLAFLVEPFGLSAVALAAAFAAPGRRLGRGGGGPSSWPSGSAAKPCLPWRGAGMYRCPRPQSRSRETR